VAMQKIPQWRYDTIWRDWVVATTIAADRQDISSRLPSTGIDPRRTFSSVRQRKEAPESGWRRCGSLR
jgi:hypothetical protein